METLAFSNRFGHYYLKAIEEIFGRKGCLGLLHLAELPQFMEAFPPDNLEPQFNIEFFSAINIGFLKLFGRIGGSGLAYRAGRASFQHIREHTGLIPIDDAGRKSLRTPHPCDEVVPLLVQALTRFTDRDVVEIQGHGDSCDVVFRTCPACYGYDSETIPLRMGKKDTTPVCKGIVGWLEEGMLWATGQAYSVEETACRAAQAVDHCVFRINKAT